VTALDPFAHYDGAYVLGALSDEEHAEFERHLATCAACTDRVHDMGPLPGLLAGLPASAYATDLDGPPATLLRDLLRHVNSERRRRHWLTAGLAGVAAACLVTLAAVLWPTDHAATPGSGAPPPQAMSAVTASPVHATAALTDVRWGTQIRLTCRYDAGQYAPNVSYQLVVIDKHKVAHSAGSWLLTPGRAIQFTGGTALSRDQISKIEITLPNNQPVLQLTL
jgi:hypothetical protein